jgi:hypothetical protein
MRAFGESYLNPRRVAAQKEGLEFESVVKFSDAPAKKSCIQHNNMLAT